MAYDQGLAERIHGHLNHRGDVIEKKMFGGLCFMVSGHMCCGIVGERLMARVGPEAYEELLNAPHIKEMDFTGKPMKGMLYVNPEGISEESDLAAWINICVDFVNSLPPK
ncbi:MAG: TfoX/Sxy family protein [Motiliproteus sp.]